MNFLKGCHSEVECLPSMPEALCSRTSTAPPTHGTNLNESLFWLLVLGAYLILYFPERLAQHHPTLQHEAHSRYSTLDLPNSSRGCNNKLDGGLSTEDIHTEPMLCTLPCRAGTTMRGAVLGPPWWLSRAVGSLVGSCERPRKLAIQLAMQCTTSQGRLREPQGLGLFQPRSTGCPWSRQRWDACCCDPIAHPPWTLLRDDRCKDG